MICANFRRRKTLHGFVLLVSIRKQVATTKTIALFIRCAFLPQSYIKLTEKQTETYYTYVRIPRSKSLIAPYVTQTNRARTHNFSETEKQNFPHTQANLHKSPIASQTHYQMHEIRSFLLFNLSFESGEPPPSGIWESIIYYSIDVCSERLIILFQKLKKSHYTALASARVLNLKAPQRLK